jgi:hypothetical protein
MNKGIWLLITLSLLIVSGCSTVVQEVHKAPAADCDSINIMAENGCKKTDGIPYYLPRTAIKLQFPVTKNTETEPLLFSEARKVFAVKNGCKWNKNDDQDEDKKPNLCDGAAFERIINALLISKFKETKESAGCTDLKTEASKVGLQLTSELLLSQPKVTFKLGDIGVSTEAEPDPDQLYFIKLDGGIFEKRNMEVTYSPGGVISEYSASSEDKKGEFILKTATAVLGAVTQTKKMTHAIDKGKKVDNTVIETVKECTGEPPIDYQGLVIQAATALNYLKSYSDLRVDELKGFSSAESSKESLEFRLKELDASRDTALAMVKTQKKPEIKAYSLSLLPSCSGGICPAEILKTSLAVFSNKCGLYTNAKVGALMYQSDIPKTPKTLNECGKGSPITLTLNKPPHLSGANADPSRFEHLKNPDKKRGMHYRVPMTVRTTVSKNDEEILVKDMAIAQFGAVASLPAETGSSNVSYKVTLDPVTGMLLKVSLTSESANTSAGKDIIDPISNYLAAKKESKDEITKLEREEAILKLKKSIKELKQAVGD